MAIVIKKEDSLEIKCEFNEFCIREMGFEIDENDYLCDETTQSILQIKEKFIKYNNEDVYPILKANEIDLNLIENTRLMETIFQVYIINYANSHNMNLHGFAQSSLRGTEKGKFSVSYIVNGEVMTIESDPFENESLRIFNLVCKLNHRTIMYKPFERFDVIIEKDRRK